MIKPPAFIPSTPIIPSGRHRQRSCTAHHLTTWVTVSRASRLLVVELNELEKQSNASVNKEFHERVAVDHKQSETTYVVYSSPFGYDQAMRKVSNNQFASPDALVAVSGSEIYQKRCRVPDPYWEQTIRAGWDPKPIKWCISSFFEKDLEERGEDYDQDFEIHYEVKNVAVDRKLFAKTVSDKLAELGLTCRVRAASNAPYFTIVPAAGSTRDAIEFCQKMLNIDQDCTFVFGSGPYVKSFTEAEQNWGISHVSYEAELKNEVSSNRVFLSSKVGTAGLLDGILHYAVF